MNTYFTKLNGEEMQPDDIVIINRHKYIVADVLESDHYGRDGYFSEFRDANGNLHYWKQYIDGGDLFRVVDHAKSGTYYDEHGNQCYLDCYGTEVNDLFEKYGYSL